MSKTKDWTRGTNSIFKTLGASNHVEEQREMHDYYATEPRATELLLELEEFNNCILEPACGEGHMSDVLISRGYNVTSYDLIDRGYGDGVMDFLSDDIQSWHGDIITNPPYKFAKQFVEKSLDIIPEGNKVAMFLKLLFMESQGRKDLFINNPPKVIYVSSSRLSCAKNGDFTQREGSAIAYAWYIWEKGYKGDTVVKWFN